MYDNTVAWLDLPDLQAKLPTFKEKIFVKATRVSWESSNPYGHYRVEKKVSNGEPHSSKNIQQNNTQSPSSVKQQKSEEKPKPKE